jgi:hypothetical protein
MTVWTNDELATIGDAEELTLAPARRDGTLVSLVETDAANEAIATAYHAKYARRYPSIVPGIVALDARAATLTVVPR